MPAPIVNSLPRYRSPKLWKKSILQSFLSNMDYTPLDITPTNVELEAMMRSEMETRNIQCIQLERTLHLAASFVELGYRGCSLAEKKNIALYNWYGIYIDDVLSKDPLALREFAKRFLSGQPQLNPILTALTEVLMNMWDLYDPLFVNSIVACIIEFITSNCIEPQLETMPLAEGVMRFAPFMRDKSGGAAGYALQIFTKSGNFTMMELLQALPDMYYWMNLTNDLLSFHKEELEDDKGNYVHIRANAENLSPLEVLATMAEELRVSRATIHATLGKCPRVLNAWKAFEQGYVQWHLIQERYKLSDLGL